MHNKKRVYWDACTWTSYINQEKSVPQDNGDTENRFEMCLEILKDAKKNKLEIVTSTFTLAEVCKSPDIKSSPLDNLPSFFEKSYILTIAVDMAIGRQAQNLQTTGIVNLKPPDAVHIASAQRFCLTSITLSAWRQLSWPHLLFHGFTVLLFLSVTSSFQFNDGSVMNESVDRRHGHDVVREDSIPFTERLV